MRDAGSPGARRIGWATKAMILAGGPAVGLASSLITSILPRIQEDLARGPEDQLLVKMLVGVVGVALVIGAPLAGFLSDRIGIRRILIVSYGFYTVAGTAGLYLDSLEGLIVSRLVLGIAAAGAVTAGIIIVNSWLSPEQRPTWVGAYIAAALASSILLHPLGGVLAEFDWHWTFAIYIIGLPFLLIAAFAFRDEAPIVREHAATPDRVALHRWFPLRFALVGVLIGSITFLPVIYAPFVLKRMGIDSPALISLVLTGDLVTGAITATLYGRVRRVLSERATFATAFALAGGGAVVTAFAANYWTVIVGMGVFGCGTAWFLPTLMLALGLRVDPDQQGRAAGLVKAANYLGSPIAIFVAEPAAQAYGPAVPILGAAVLAFGLLAATLARRSGSSPALRMAALPE